jgi:hypothetical protein
LRTRRCLALNPQRRQGGQRTSARAIRPPSRLKSLGAYARYAYSPVVEFEWDPAKSAATEQNRGIGFARAAEIFTGRTLEWTDNRYLYGEARIRALGASAGEVLHVVYTKRGTVVRIISARRANRKERAQWLSSA